MTKTLLKTLIAAAALAAMTGAIAQQTKLKWAHVYETSEPFHTSSVWAAAEIEKRTAGRYHIDVYPASQLGKENDINQGLTLGTVDMIISGSSFAAKSYPRIGVTYYPYTFRGVDHLLAARPSSKRSMPVVCRSSSSRRTRTPRCAASRRPRKIRWPMPSSAIT